MSDYCVVCGDTEADSNSGEYLEFENFECKIVINRFVCYDCMAKKGVER